MQMFWSQKRHLNCWVLRKMPVHNVGPVNHQMLMVIRSTYNFCVAVQWNWHCIVIIGTANGFMMMALLS